MNRIVVVTGASSGLGRALAIRLAHFGDHLILVARRERELRQVAQECGDAMAVVGSVAEESTWHAIRDLASALHGEELILVNNAGLARFGPYHESDFPDWQELIHTNLIGAMGLTHALIPAMLEKKGRVVNILSIAVKTPLPGAAVYTAAKAGLEGFTRSLAAEYRKQGILFTNIYPGASDTTLWDALSGHPPRDQMIPGDSLADTIFEALITPRDRVIDELTITPPLGIL